ncbi:hypothetical protein LCE31_05430 [Streptomyces sp. 8L]|nr:hypothetical protein [Streptomyces sp. 8L]
MFWELLKRSDQIRARWSREMCAGLRVEHTSRIGVIAVASEHSTGAGIRTWRPQSAPSTFAIWRQSGSC